MKGFQMLYRIGFRLISYDPNLIMIIKTGKVNSHLGFSELLFARPTIDVCDNF